MARAIYALNWFDIAPGLAYISTDLGLKIVQLGIATTFFYIGLAPFQLVGGALASRIGSRKVAFIGLVILGLGAVASGLSKNLFDLSASRFIAGCGSAFFFSPGLAILRDISPPESYPFQVGIYNGVFGLGAGIGALGWVFVDKAIGWQLGLIAGGLLIIGVAIENFIVLRGDAESKAESVGLSSKIFAIVRNKYLWFIAIGTLAATFVETIGGQFLVLFGEKYMGINKIDSGFIDGLFLMIGFLGGVVGGHLLSKVKIRMPFVYTILIVASITFMAIPFARNLLLLTAIVAACGFSVQSGFSALYVLAVPRIRDNAMIPFALSFVNFIGIAVGSVSPFAFTLIVNGIGPAYGWIILGIVGILLIPFLFLSTKNEEVGQSTD